MSMPRPLPLLAAALLALAACGQPNYYLLPVPQSGASRPAPVGSVVVADLSLPAYAEAIEVASLTGPSTLELRKRALWADTPRRAMTRQLAASLDDRLSARVATEPWPGFDSPGLRVEVIVDRMVGALDGGLEFTGQYFIVAPVSGRIVTLERFALTVPPQGEGYPGLMAAHARALDLLADRVAASITGRRPTS
jgi:uncharacterized lipoprotein YmbA